MNAFHLFRKRDQGICLSRLLKTSCIGLALILCTSFTLQAQEGKISGVVTDDSGAHMYGVTVSVKGTTIGVATSAKGEYSIDAPKGSTLLFSFIGYTPQEIVIGNQAVINIKLRASSIGMEEVVVVGYGTQSRRTVTSAISKVNGDVLSNIPISSVGEGLKGKVAGTRIYSSNFAPGADPIIRVRGGSSINKSNDPLILVDGVERPFSGINPNDIESIDVLKDAASTAIYGSRGSNGVVIVTTRSGGGSRSPRVTFDASWAYQDVTTRYDLMGSEDYINTVRPAVLLGPNYKTIDTDNYSTGINTPGSVYSTRYLGEGEAVPSGYKSMPDPVNPDKTLIFQDNDFQDAFYKPSLWQNYYVGVDGGSSKSQYAASVGYTKDQGVALASGYERFVARISLVSNITKKLKFKAITDYSDAMSDDYPNQKNVISRGLSSAPTMKLYFDDGTPAYGYNKTSLNPLYYEYITERHNRNKRLSLVGGLNYTIVDGLKADVQASFYNHTHRNGSFENANYFSSTRPAWEKYAELARTKLETFLSYNKTFKQAHTVSAMGGYSYMINKNNSMGAEAEGASSDKIPILDASPIKTGASSDLSSEVLIGYFARVSYDYKKKYMITGTFRADGSSKFAPGNQWGYFPGVSAGWMISEEKFLDNAKFLDYLKFRVSYGQTGNNAIGLFDARGEYGNNRYDGNSGMIPTKIPNESLTWEVSDQLDAGFDAAFFNGRLSVSADYFNKITNNLLFSKDMPNTSGYKTIQTNIGKVRFRGFDLEIASRNIVKKDFRWDSKFTWSFVKNMVLKLPDNGRDRNRIGGITLGDGSEFGGTAEGEPLYRYYGYVVSHILQTDEEAKAAMYDNSSQGWDPITHKKTKGKKYAGDYEWVNRPGSDQRLVQGVLYDQINAQDRFELGSTTPHSTGGLNNTFKYKNITLNVFMDWALGHSILNTTEARYFINTFTGNTAISNKLKNSWKQPGDDTRYAKFQSGGETQSANYRASSLFNNKADYLCLREISLSYDLPKKLISKLGIQQAAVTLSGNNLHYFTAIEGVSPEVGTADTYNDSYSNYPPIRRLSIGLKITF